MATTIQCPDCLSEIGIQSPRPGRFRSKCPKCLAPFAVMVPEEEGASIVVASLGASPTAQPVASALAESGPGETVLDHDPDETVSQEVPPAPGGDDPHQAAPGRDD